MSTELTLLEKAKLVIIDTDNFTDDDAMQAFLDVDISNIDDINEITITIEKHRPELCATITKWFGI
ncbi:MAG: hypothetical protein AAB969_02735 [Patescibacteria group bacterium]